MLVESIIDLLALTPDGKPMQFTSVEIQRGYG